MAWFSQLTSKTAQMYKKFQGVGCTSDYHKTKTEIEQQIDALYNVPNQFCNRCKNLKKNIIKKNTELQSCYNTSGLLSIVSTENINKFINSCPDSNCRYPPITRNKPVVLKQPNKNPCSIKGGCTEKVAPPKAQKDKPSPALVAENSKAKSLEGKASQAQDQRHSVADVNTLSLPQIKASNSYLGNQHEVSESRVNHPSGKPESLDKQVQHPSVQTTSPSSELNIPSIAFSSQSTFNGDSASSSNSQEERLDNGTSEGNQVVDRNVGNNQLQEHSVDVQSSIPEVPVDETDTVREHINGDLVNQVIFKEGTGNEGLNTMSPEGLVSSDGDVGAQDEIGTGSDSIIVQTLNRDSGGDNHGTMRNEIDYHTKISDFNDAGDEPRSSEHSYIRHTYSTEKGNELTNDKSDIIGKIFEAISNNDHIIQASVPMGIVLLLSLLFKYTPLWRVLTKKDRKKGAGIIEELNSVVQEPSIMDEERSIPFSYGAFEYSTFDQNVY
ncbi:hypothetical protein PVBG_05036 [Plasmodium vivax Brazil I]|uniref:Variable surface protein Vir18 n=1 Tax=Plasmodium vivax (strain Brazil I) TaxID=1033975 RepID=A0A0J9SY30_PLAV1|nr:hypothetical protein PVBG_05036 [Plasmodium vivax Brazil I]